MLSREQLIQEISATMGKTKVIELTALLNEHNFPLSQLIDLTIHPDKNIAFRASWLLENRLMASAEPYIGDFPYLFERFTAVEYPSCQRHYANIITRLTSPKAGKTTTEALAVTDMESVVEKLFDWLIDPKILVAVKCSSAEALMHLSTRYDWIAEELRNQLSFLMRNGTAAIQARGKMILKKLGPSAP